MSTGATSNLGLSQWQLTDRFLMEEMNEDNRKIDAAVKQLSLEKIGSIVTTDTCLQIDLDVSEIDWSRYFEVLVNYRLRYDSTAEINSYVRANKRCSVNDYYYRALSGINGRGGNSECLYVFTDFPAYPEIPNWQQLRIDAASGSCIVTMRNISYMRSEYVDYGGVLRASAGGTAPLPLADLQTLNFYSKRYDSILGGYVAVPLAAGCEFYIYGVKK